jgi:hypothetical protein
MSDEMQPDAAESATISTETAEIAPPDVDGAENAENAAPEDSDAFDRAYVEKLRKESAGYRDKAKTAEAHTDAANKRLHAALVTATGRLADPADLPYDTEHLDDPDALNAAIDSLLEAKPHFRSRVPRGDVGQGVKDSAAPQFDLGAMLRSRV